MKNLGPQCPACGNPINPANGNKFQMEVDYRASGGQLLRFERFYNSQLRTANRESGYYSTTSYFDSFGNQAMASIAVSDPEESDYWKNIAVDAIGANWRHNYQRSINFNREATLLNVRSAFAFRPDGRVFAFNEYNGGFVGPKDVNDRLVRTLGPGNQLVGWEYHSGTTLEVEIYDATGRMTELRDSRGESLTFSYDAIGRLSQATDSFGRSIAFEYDELPTASARTVRIRRVVVPGGGVYAYTYGSNGTIQSVTYPDGASRTYLYENATYPRALTGILDENGARFSSWTYDQNGWASESKHGVDAGRVTLTFDGGAGKAWMTDSKGVTRRWEYGAVIRGVAKVTLMTQPAASGTGTINRTFAYDANGNEITRIDFDGKQINRVFDLTRNLETSRTEAHGTPRARTTTTQWNATYPLPTQIDEVGRRTTFTYDVKGNLLTKTVLDTVENTSRTWTYTHNVFGRLLTADGPRTDVNDITSYSYYSCVTGYQCGQLYTVTNALGHVTTYGSYNAHGQPLNITDQNGVITTLTYDARQRLTSRTVGSEQISFTYWPTGLLKRVTPPDGSYLEYTYDTAHRLIGISDSEGNRISYTLDAMGNRTHEEIFDPSNSLRVSRTRVFNVLNQLWKDLSASATEMMVYDYDNGGNVISTIASLGRNSTQAYDELNRLSQITDPAGATAKYRYNALDQLISVTDPRNRTTGYTYNALGDLKQQVSPATGVTSQTFDSSGNVSIRSDARGKAGTYSYDALNRVIQISYPDQTIQYGYDQGGHGIGHLTEVTDGSGATSWTYDGLGRVTSRHQTMSGFMKAVGYAYDTSGQLYRLTMPSGNFVTYAYLNGRVSGVSLNGSVTVLSNVLYEPFGPTRGWSWGNLTLAVREYDTDGKIVTVDSADAKAYAYDDAFRITGITDLADATRTQSYGYDVLDRLSGVTGTGLNLAWLYDQNGNRLLQGGGSSAIAARQLTFTYDDAGRMSSATSGASTVSYKVNALGQRVRKTVAGVSTYFVYGESGHLLGEYDNAGNLIQETVWLDDIPVATLRPNGSGGVSVFYVHTDHLNTPRRVSRPSDNVIVWRWDSDPFGTTLASEDPDGDSNLFVYNLRFPGQYFDGETGLHYNYFRDYDPGVGRYVQSDPIGQGGGLNTYAYVGSSPISAVDPFGLQVAVPAPVIAPPVAGPLNPSYPSDGGLGNLMRNIGDAITEVAYRCANQCPPCKTVSGKTVPLGTIGYRPLDVIPDNVKQHGVYGSHHNLFKANQIPYPNCDCFWQKLKDIAKPGQLQPGWIPIEPFAN